MVWWDDVDHSAVVAWLGKHHLNNTAYYWAPGHPTGSEYKSASLIIVRDLEMALAATVKFPKIPYIMVMDDLLSTTIPTHNTWLTTYRAALDAARALGA